MQTLPSSFDTACWGTVQAASKQMHNTLAMKQPSVLGRMKCERVGCQQQQEPTCSISSVVSESVARAEPSARRGSSPLVIRVCLAGASPEQVQVKLSVVSTGTATVSTGMLGRYLATNRAVEPPRVRTTISDAWTCRHSKQQSFMPTCMTCNMTATSVQEVTRHA